LNLKNRCCQIFFNPLCRYFIALKPKSVLNFHRQLVGNEFPALVDARGPLPVVILDDEEIAERSKRPAQLVVGAKLPALRVILRKTAQLQIGREVQLQPKAEQLLLEVLPE